MLDPVQELKVRAEIMQRQVQALEPAALERLRALPEYRRAEADVLRGAAPNIQRKHCLAAVARELGFANWEHARRVLEGDASEQDFGKLLYDKVFGAGLNVWSAHYDEARELRQKMGTPQAPSFLLAYQRQFFIVDRYFIEALGLEPEDADFEAIGWDWAHPNDTEARRRLYAKLLAARRARESA
jgi:hypothetical protein